MPADRMLKDLARRVAELERSAVRVRHGDVTFDGSAIDLSLGGSEEAFEDVRTIRGAQLGDGDRVVTLVKDGDLLILGSLDAEWTDLGAHFGDQHGTAIGSVAVGNSDRLFVVYTPILHRATITGIRYRTGASTSGNVRSGLYNADGDVVASRTSDLSVAGTQTIQNVAFASAYDAAPGIYFRVLIFSASSMEFRARRSLVPTSRVNNGSMTLPSSITAPTTSDDNDMPVSTTY